MSPKSEHLYWHALLEFVNLFFCQIWKNERQKFLIFSVFRSYRFYANLLQYSSDSRLILAHDRHLHIVYLDSYILTAA